MEDAKETFVLLAQQRHTCQQHLDVIRRALAFTNTGEKALAASSVESLASMADSEVKAVANFGAGLLGMHRLKADLEDKIRTADRLMQVFLEGGDPLLAKLSGELDSF